MWALPWDPEGTTSPDVPAQPTLEPLHIPKAQDPMSAPLGPSSPAPAMPQQCWSPAPHSPIMGPTKAVHPQARVSTQPCPIPVSRSALPQCPLAALLLPVRPCPDGLEGAPIAPSTRASGSPQPGLHPDKYWVLHVWSLFRGGNGHRDGGYGSDA